MDSASTDHRDVPIQISISNITTIDDEVSNPPTISLKVTLRNASDKPVSFLRWSTPFDQRAVPMGIFKFRSIATGHFAPCLDLKINRRIPREGVFSDDDIISIDAGEEVSKTFEVRAPELVLTRGEKYLVNAEGFWMHVFIGDRDEARRTEAEVLSEDFESDGVEVEL